MELITGRPKSLSWESCKKSVTIGFEFKRVDSDTQMLLYFSAIKGKLNTPCLENDVCTDANTVCSSGVCICTEESYDREGLCGKIFCTLLLYSSIIILFSNFL